MTDAEVTNLVILRNPEEIYHAIITTKIGELPEFPAGYRTLEEVSQFLDEYYSEKWQAGFTATVDPVSDLTEALRVALGENQCSDNSIPPPLSNSGELQVNNEAGNDNEQPRVPQTNLSEQRQRAANTSLNDIAKFIHLPIEEAAKEIGLCITTLRRIRREKKLGRWPFRKINSAQKKISSLLSSNDPQQLALAGNEISRLLQEIENIYQEALGGGRD
ncbi:hypothetical protein SLEP1_g56817 [Rubroshorea leprosula]|uniref:RWP-RK domain-containing protein n=1 Tax=Rubroshorea leprosula TaxID=152421 RepID=A0AAV5MKQ5_9ROSI|nr:hypothetical protein SLEP1_g56817 [Rubroshorea leprosula]